MWFKQAKVFQLADGLVTNADSLAEKLSALPFQECLPSVTHSYGWMPPLEPQDEMDEPSLVFAANNYLLFSLQIEEKVLPATVVRQTLDKKVKEIKSAEGRKLSRKEKTDLKDEITFTLLPRAFTKLSSVHGLIDLTNNWLVVDATENSKLDKFLNAFRKVVGDHSLSSLETKKIAPILTRWVVSNEYPSSFGIEKSCVFRDPTEQSRVIRCQQQDLFAPAIQTLLQDGCEINQITLNWLDRATFTITDDMTLKSIKYSEEIVEAAKDLNIETAHQQFAANFHMMTETLGALLTELLDLFLLPVGAKVEKAAYAELVD